MSKGKKLSMIELLATVITVVLVVEAASPVAAIGSSQFFYWILLTFTFLLPYGLIASELGTTYQSEGGVCDWIDRAFGRRWGARSAWYYWINFPIWMASLAVMTPLLLEYVFGFSIPVVPALIIELVFIWLVVFLGMSPASEKTWIFNICAILKILLALGVGFMGIYAGITHGFANELTVESLFPRSLEEVAYLPVVLFNFLGFEVVCTFADSMENPKKQIPKAIIAGGLAIAGIYMISSFGIGAAVPVDEISTATGIVDAFVAITGQAGGPFIAVVSLLFLLTLFGNMISWSMGVNNVVAYTADRGGMPKVFARRNPKNNVPTGAAITNGVVASIIVIAALIIPNQDIFWTFFSLNLFAFLVSYLPVFPAFLKLRKMDADIPRPYKVPGGQALLRMIAYVPLVELVLCLVFIAVPLGFDAETLAGTLPITIGAVLIVVIDEVYIRFKGIKKGSDDGISAQEELASDANL